MKEKPSFRAAAHVRHRLAHDDTGLRIGDAEFERLSAFTNIVGLDVDLVCAGLRSLQTGALVTFNAAWRRAARLCVRAISFFYSNALVRIDAWAAGASVLMSGAASEKVKRNCRYADTPSRLCGGRCQIRNVINRLHCPLWDAIRHRRRRRQIGLR